MRMTLLTALSFLLIAPSAQAQADMYNGRPTFTEGVELGYYLWRDGDTWRLRWTTMGQMRSFTGSVTAEGGELKSLKRIDVESESKVLYPGRPRHTFIGPKGRVRVAGGRAPVVVTKEQDKIDKDGDNRIVFNTKTNDDIDGFDFKVDDQVVGLRFVLLVDNHPVPNLVEVGQRNQKPREAPLVVRLRP